MTESKINRIARALERVSSEPTERGCLLWEGATNPKGYGQVRLGGKKLSTHRLAWAFGLNGERHGALPPPDVVIRHRCDVPRCCNPDHLQAGTVVDNNRDRDERGRTARGDASGSRTHPERRPRGDAHSSRKHPERRPRGEANGNAKLSDEAVAKVFLLRAEGLLQREIAKMVGCSRPHVCNILRGALRVPLNPKKGLPLAPHAKRR